MYTANTTLNIIDSAFGVIEAISEHDYKKSGERLIAIIATAAAIIVGVITYCNTAFLCWWDTHGERIMIDATRFTFNFIDTVGVIYYAGVNSRPVINRWVAQLADRVYFTAVAL